MVAVLGAGTLSDVDSNGAGLGVWGPGGSSIHSGEAVRTLAQPLDLAALRPTAEPREVQVPAVPPPVRSPTEQVSIVRVGGARGGLRELLAAYPWPVEEAWLVIHGPTPGCPNGESSGSPSAYNDNNYGLFAINAVHADRVGGNLELLYDPAVNVRVAWELYSEAGGWGRDWVACAP